MEKLKYMTPLIEVIELDSTETIMESSFIGVTNTESDTFDAQGRRGSWGNLWEE